MKITGRYCSVSALDSNGSEEFLQGEIDRVNTPFKNLLADIDNDFTKDDAKEIKKALMDSLIHSI